MPVFSIVANKSYTPSDNPINRFRGTVGATASSATVSVTTDAGLVSLLNSLKSSRTITVTSSTLPNGGTITTASGSTLTITYPYTVSSIAVGQTNDWLNWYYLDAPNAAQLPITYFAASGAFNLDYMDVDGTRGTISAASGFNHAYLSVYRSLATTTGTILGYSKGNSN